jgi:hypothetical protein
VFKKEDEKEPFVLMGGKIDALIIHATGHNDGESQLKSVKKLFNKLINFYSIRRSLPTDLSNFY